MHMYLDLTVISEELSGIYYYLVYMYKNVYIMTKYKKAANGDEIRVIISPFTYRVTPELVQHYNH